MKITLYSNILHRTVTVEAHAAITADTITDAVEREMSSLDNPGFCVACGEEADGVEPDACNYECEGCGERMVYGAQELLLGIA